MEKAVACGLDINEQCSNYKIDLTPRNQHADSDMFSLLLSPTIGGAQHEASGNKFFEPLPAEASASLRSPQENVTYLNVHSGVSAGLMAGVDVGAGDRWEYLLIGQPMADVAVAEGLAGQGELVVAPAAHRILCKDMLNMRQQTASATTAELNDNTSDSTVAADTQQQQQQQHHEVPKHFASCGCEVLSTLHLQGDDGYVISEPAQTPLRGGLKLSRC